MAPLAPSPSAPATHSQPSRRGKRAWRKNVDISEVVSGLDSLREEIRTTGGPVAEQSNDQLFALDTAGDDEIKRTHKLNKPLKVDQILAERSAVPAVDSRKRKQGLLGDGVYESSSKRRKEGWVAKKDVQRLKDTLNNTSHLATDKVGDEGPEFDLWAAPLPTPTVSTKRDEYIPKPRAKVAPATISKAPIPMTASGKPTQAVAAPNAGTSYNPTFEDWDALITREGEKEVTAEQIRLSKARADAEKQARVDLIAAKPDDGYETGGESAWEGFETENDDEESLKKKRPQRKTPQQRKKAERRKERERAERHEAAMGRKEKQKQRQILEAVTTLSKTDAEQELVVTADSVPTEETPEDTTLRRRKMGPVAIPEKQLEVVLPDELQDSLRRLKPEGNLMTDRFRNLLVNGKIEARKRVLESKKRRVKTTEKWSYKDFSIRV